MRAFFAASRVGAASGVGAGGAAAAAVPADLDGLSAKYDAAAREFIASSAASGSAGSGCSASAAGDNLRVKNQGKVRSGWARCPQLTGWMKSRG